MFYLNVVIYFYATGIKKAKISFLCRVSNTYKHRLAGNKRATKKGY